MSYKEIGTYSSLLCVLSPKLMPRPTARRHQCFVLSTSHAGGGEGSVGLISETFELSNFNLNCVYVKSILSNRLTSEVQIDSTIVQQCESPNSGNPASSLVHLSFCVSVFLSLLSLL
jgi:hypothetical protein